MTITTTTSEASCCQQLREHLNYLRLQDAAAALPAVLDQTHPKSYRLGYTRLEPVWMLWKVRPMPETWSSADDIATHLGVTKDTVYAWIAEKSMPAHKVGRLWKFQTSEVDAWVRSSGAAASDEASSPG